MAPNQPLDAALDEDDRAEKGIALCLSGGGYRAMVFHVGALWRLNEAGLPAPSQDLDRIRACLTEFGDRAFPPGGGRHDMDGGTA